MQAIVEAVSGPGKGRRLTLKLGDVFVVGRTEWADVCIGNDQQMSARHFAVESGSAGLRLVDQGSTNGTQVNGDFVKEAPLNDGDQIVAGTTTFQVRVEQAAAGSPSPFGVEGPATTPEMSPGPGGPPPGFPASEGNPIFASPAAPPDASPAAPDDGPLGWVEQPTTPENFGGPLTPPAAPSDTANPSPFGEPVPTADGPFDIPQSGQGSVDAGIPGQGGELGGAIGGPVPLSESPTGADASPFGSPPAASDSPFAAPTQPTSNSPFELPPGGGMPPGAEMPSEAPTAGEAVPIPPAGESPSPFEAAGSPGGSVGGPSADPAEVVPPQTPNPATPQPATPQPAPVPISPISNAPTTSSSPAAEPMHDEQAIAVKADIRPASGAVLQYSIHGCKSEKVICLRANYGEAAPEFTPSSLMVLLKRHLPLVVIAHFQKGGLEHPEELTESTPLLHWLPEETSLNFGPVMIPPTQQIDRLLTIDQLWDKDACLCFYARDIHAAMEHLKQLLRLNLNGEPSEDGIFGYCWPAVIHNLLENQEDNVIDLLMGDVIDCVLMEVPGVAGQWQIFGNRSHVDMLNQTGFVEMPLEAEASS